MKSPNFKQPHTLVDLLRERASSRPDWQVYTFLNDGEQEEIKLTAAGLDLQARRIAAILQKSMKPGERALLLYPPGLDYISAFFGCLYAGVVAVPAYPPDPNRLSRTLPRLQAIIKDSQATTVLTTEMIRSMASFLFEQAPDLGSLHWMATDQAQEGIEAQWKEPELSSKTLSFLQYTSGSTGVPKGVMLSHGNLLHNLKLIQDAYEVTEESMGVIWLPSYHDMGLIGGILGTLSSGNRTVLLSPLAFLQKPLRWLQAISRYKATISGGPNFAYEMCIRKVTPEQKAGLDLSTWSLAFSGAEPIRVETLDRFSEAFAECGFDRRAFYPCYGLAEGSLIVTGGRKSNLPFVKTLLNQEVENHRAKEVPAGTPNSRDFVGCGKILQDQKLIIASSDTQRRLGEKEIGEIWISGPSVAQGYWNQPEETARTFQATLSDSGEGPFLRTGDLGFLSEGELFVTGRLKDLIIIRGQNHYPQDIERTVEACHPALRLGCTAAFSVEGENEERLVVLQELEKGAQDVSGFDPQAVFSTIRETVILQHEIETASIVLLKTGSIPKTSSGKISRYACREAFLQDTLEKEAEWHRQKRDSRPRAELLTFPGVSHKTPPQGSIQKWLVDRLAQSLSINPQQIDVKQTFLRYGLDSKEAVNLSGELEAWLGMSLPPTLLWKYPTIEALSTYLAEMKEAR
ncbi:MAG: AMP-binding protein [bacterium]